MTKDETCKCYNIPKEILDEYEKWGLCGSVRQVMGAWQYDDSDIERLSMIMTLHDIGFESGEIETYMRLMLEGSSTENERLKMLNEKRTNALDEIHFKEKQLERLDYIRHQMRKNCSK